ncbi:MAG TPA: hypothetical protein VH482_25545 [Thermomicrobiales bacterium]
MPAFLRQNAWAQGTTSLDGLGLPEIKITMTDAGFTVTPKETTAGWTLVTFTNSSSEEDDAADIVLIPSGMTADDINNSLATPTPSAPSWAFQTTFAGGPFAGKGKTTQDVVNLTAGDWYIFSGGEPQFAADTLTVTAGASASPVAGALTADVEVSLQEYTFLGLEKPVPAGSHLWKVTNTGKQPHLMIITALPSGITTEQLQASMTAMMTGTPTAGAVDIGNAPFAGGCATISVGTSLYLPLDLAAGTYGALCFFPDEETGAPHALMGMAVAFTVA